MDNKNIIIILSIIAILLAIGVVLEVFVLNNSNVDNVNSTTENTTIDTNVTTISSDSQNNDQNSIDANRPRNNPNYKGYTPMHESEVTSDGWNPKEHETYRESIGGGREKIHYDDGYFTIVDENGYIITYGYA
ncbi:MAG: hypothetical protein IK044_00290 [Methanobrevibacter sp.]|nr:hypothetical protein [Methanobrevibacter sp.]